VTKLISIHLGRTKPHIPMQWLKVRARDSQSWFHCLFCGIHTSVLSFFLCCYWCFVPKSGEGIPHSHLIWEETDPNCTLFWQTLTPQYHTINRLLERKLIGRGGPWPHTTWILLGYQKNALFAFLHCWPLCQNLLGGDGLLPLQFVMLINV